MKQAAGYEISLFASEKDFPEIANPLAMTFDTRGRLWVLTSPTYPHVLPGVHNLKRTYFDRVLVSHPHFSFLHFLK